MRGKLAAAAAVILACTLAAPNAASATLPMTKSRPYQVLCESQGGTFAIAVDFRSLYCNKEGGLFTAFTPEELARQRKRCEQLYGGFFGIQGFQLPDGTTGTGTFCG